MKYYFAPLEGITGHIFRRAYDRFFGGIDAYYTPFLTTRDGGIMKKKELNDIMPENNQGLNIVPQLMTKNPDEFITAAKHIESLGYSEVNLNLGCPSGTVVPKGKGAGFLRNPGELDAFLDSIYSGCQIAVSIKSRLGFDSVDEFRTLLDIYKKYPVKLLILHLRTRNEWYEGSVHDEVFRYALDELQDTAIPLCYNGDITSIDDINRIEKKYPANKATAAMQGIMIGRGFLSHPGFAGNANLKGSYEDTYLLLDFVKSLQAEYEHVLFGETPVLFKMKELWSHLADSFPEGKKLFKRIKKSRTLAELSEIYDSLQAVTFL